VLISRAIAEGMADGSVTVAYRRWDRPRVRPGGTQRTVAGVVRFGSVEEVDPATLTEEDAARAGVRSLAELLRLLGRRPRPALDARDPAADRRPPGRPCTGPGGLPGPGDAAVQAGYEISPRGRAYLR
jgi:hypothetical protein